MITRESWIIQKTNISYRPWISLAHFIVHFFFISGFIGFIFFTLGNGKTNFSKRYFTLLNNSNLNIVILNSLCIWLYLTSGMIMAGYNKYRLSTNVISYEKLDIFSLKTKVFPVNTKPKPLKSLLYLKKNNILVYLASGIILSIILNAGALMNTNAQVSNTGYIYQSPIFFICLFIIIYDLSVLLVLNNSVPANLKILPGIQVNPRIILIVIIIIISIIAIFQSFLIYGI